MPRALIVYRFIIFLLLSSLACVGYSQIMDQEDIVYLKDGGKLKGEIIYYKQGQELKLELRNGQQVVFAEAEIEKVVQEPFKTPKEWVDPLEKGHLYHAFYFSGNLGSNLHRDNDWGMGIEHITGYWLTDRFGLGLGGGIIQYSSDYSWRVAPIFLDLKLKTHHPSPFYLGGDVGLGFPIKNDNVNVIGGEAGERFRLGVGKMWSLGGASHLNLELSYLHQRATFDSRTWSWWSEDILHQNIRFKRYQLRFGFLF